MNVVVDAVNDAQVLANLGDAVSAIEQAAVRLDNDVTVSDVELDALNGGAGLYTGATLTLARQGGTHAEDRFGFFTNGSIGAEGGVIRIGELRFATFSQGHGTLSVTFDSAETPATSTLVNLLLRSIAYTNISNTPPAQVVLAWSFSDGGPAAPGGGTHDRQHHARGRTDAADRRQRQHRGGHADRHRRPPQ